MDDYETRRKLQNREAQRRYRQKQKQRSGQGDALPGATSVNSPSASWTSGTTRGEHYGFSEEDFEALAASNSLLDDHTLQGALSTSHDGILDGFDTMNNGLTSTQYFPLDSDVGSAYSNLYGTPNRTDRSHKSDKHHRHHRSSNAGLTGSSSASSSSCSSSSSSTPSPGLPKSHAKMNTKVNRMVDDLSQLYTFGVEMQLMHPDDDLDRSLGSMRGQFQRSIHRAADGSHGYFG